MSLFKKSVELSPKLKLGVGRAHTKAQVLKLTGVFLLLIALGLAVNAARIIIAGKNSDDQGQPQVLGASDNKPNSDDAAFVQFIEYKVQKGDTLFNISQTHNIPWTTLATLNNLQSPFTLKTGQILRVPKQ
jgi:nucleoid-associated protein YgaU